MKSFIPFHELKKHPKDEVVIVDALHPDHLTLSHWKGANRHQEIQADTSAEICVNAVLIQYKNWDAPYISANHFDIDGFVGVMALLHPEMVKEKSELFVQMGEIGDFRQFNPQSSISHEALKLCIWLNKKEKNLFYVPFGEKNEIEECVKKFEFFMNEFPKVLNDVDGHAAVWQKAYDEILSARHKVQSRQNVQETRLQVVKCEETIPYYALFSETNQSDLVMSIYPNNRFELEYKYTTWVDIVSQATYPRIDLRPLAKKLNEIERSNYNWEVDRITDTGPILRLEKKKLSKADRFANPTEREIYSSSIREEDFVEICTSFLSEKLSAIKPKKFWSWNETKQINRLK